MRKGNVFKAYFCTFHLRMRGSWYATKRMFASFASVIFRKICRGPPMAKSINMVWGHTSRELIKTKNILNLRIDLFKASLSYVK